MSNSINGLSKPVAPPPSRPSEPSSTGAASARPAAGGSDSVELTDTAKLQQLMAALPATDPVDLNRVDATRQALADGQYTVDSRQIAQRLLQFDS